MNIPGFNKGKLAVRFYEAMVVLLIVAQPMRCQQSTSQDALDVRMFQTLFRRVLLYQSMAAQSAGEPQKKRHLDKIISRRLDLSEFDTDVLLRISTDYQREDSLIHAQIVDELVQFRRRFPESTVTASADTTPPARLLDLKAQEDKMILLHRDLLQNSLGAEDYYRMRSKLSALFQSGSPAHLASNAGGAR